MVLNFLLNKLLITQEKIKMQNWTVLSEDKENLVFGSENRVFCSFTYITSNYSVLFTLNELKDFIKGKNAKVFIVLWDMNTLSNPYFKRLCASRKIKNPKSFINQKVSELRKIMISMGFDKEKIFIYKSSDLWRRFVTYTSEDIFQEFYSILAQLKIKDFVNNIKCSHLIQIPMDIFFCNYFHKFYPEDTDHPIEIAFYGKDKDRLYIRTRELMVKDGLIKQKNPLFVETRRFPYLLYEDNLPEWDMSKNEIRNIIVNLDIDKKDIFSIISFISSGDDLLSYESTQYTYDEFYEKFQSKNVKTLKEIATQLLFDYLQKLKSKFESLSKIPEEEIVSFSTEKDVMNIGSTLKSKIALRILMLADGTKNTTDISKVLKKSVATISMYTHKLKADNLIETLENGKIKRKIKGLKINLETLGS